MVKNTDKILLIHPQQMGKGRVLDKLRYPPLGIAILASIIRKDGMYPFIYDANIEKGDPFKRISKLIHDEKISVIGLSFTTPLAQGAYYLADKLKQEFPKLTIIAGGYHPTVMPDEVIIHLSIDYVVVGEGETTFPSLLKVIREDGDPKNVKGLCFNHNGKIIHTDRPPLISNIDDVPIPAYDLLNLNSYSSLSSTKKPFVTVVRSRGCPFRCVFCGVGAIFSRRYRCQSPEHTLEEVLSLVKQYKVREILFKDSDFLINRKNVEEFCTLLLKEQLDLVWSCNARVDRVDEDILRLMRRAGCNQVTFGIESGSQRMLDALKKDFTVGHIIKAVKLTKKQGIVCVGNFIIGTPGEDHATIVETARLIKTLDLDYASFHFLTAFPGSVLYEQAIQNRWFVGGQQFQGYEEVNINATKLSKAELKEAMRWMIRSFYFRPSYILKRLMQITPSEIRNNFVGGFGLLRKILGK